MQNMIYRIIDLFDDIVDSGNMILVQCTFLLISAISFSIVIILDVVDNNLFQNLHAREMFFVVYIVAIIIAAELWLYHRIVRSDSFY
jgi:hypothetical protein